MDNYIITASLKSEQTGKLINRIPGSRLLLSSLPGSTSRMHIESLSKPRDSTSLLKALPGKLDIKRREPGILYICMKCRHLYLCSFWSDFHEVFTQKLDF